MKIVLQGVRPYDGRYDFDWAEELTTREFGWIKRLSGYLPLNIEEAVEGGDPEFFCACAAIALHRAGRVDARDVPQVFERLVDAPFGSAITVEVDEAEAEEEDEPSPPEPSSNGSASFSGDDSTTSSGTSPPIRTVSGMPASASSGSGPATSEK
jgi:hypothetical protein